MQIEIVPIGAIRPYEKNAKIHTPEQVEQIKKSILEFGNNDPIAIDKDGVIIEGHGRLMALKELGYTEVEVIRLGHLTEEQRKAYTLVHNKLTMNTGFDLELLAEELANIDGINMADYDFDLDLGADYDIADVEEDNYEPDIPAEPKAKRGQVYQLGNHRLMCGDSTSLDDVKKLMGDEEADLLLTDPPYNVNYGVNLGPRRKNHRAIEHDNMDDESFYNFLCAFYEAAQAVMKPGASFYIWHADNQSLTFRQALKDSGFELRQTLIWNKNTFTLGRQDYQCRHEPCLYGWKAGAAHYFTTSRNEVTVYDDDEEVPDFKKLKKDELVQLLERIYGLPGTVIDENKPTKADLHPTMKPLKLMAYQIQNSTKKGGKVLDLFGGSGSTLIAAEETKRVCYMMEYDPRYVDVIIDRWEQQTGRQATLLTE